MTRIYFLNEGVLVRFLLDAVLGRKPVVFAFTPWFRFNLSWMVRMVGFFRRRGLVAGKRDIDPCMPWIEGVPGRGFYNDAFMRAETAARERFDVDTVRDWQDGYDYPARKAVSWWVNELSSSAMLYEWLADNRSADVPWAVIGCPVDLIWLIGQIGLTNKGLLDLRVSRPLAPFVNALSAIATGLFSILWLLMRIRRVVTQRRCVLFADGRAPYDRPLLESLVDKPADLTIYHRNKDLARAETWAGWSACSRADGRLTGPQFLDAAFEVVRDLATLWHRFGKLEPALFNMIAAQAVKRQMFRAMFNVTTADYFWCRDDYSVDHIVRNQEFRRTGGRTLGVNHGLPRVTYFHAWREVDADLYLSFGTHLYEKYYRQSWPPHLRLVPIGNSRLGFDAFDPGEYKPTKDIAVFAMMTRWNEKFCNEALALARALPDRRVIFKMKPDRHPDELQEYEQALADVPENFIWDDTNTYDLLKQISYSVTCGSTVGAEALQFGVASFVIDLDPDEPDFLYRDFPEMHVFNAADIVERIVRIEDGSRPYRFDAMSDLIVMPPRDPSSEIRAVMGNGQTPAAAPREILGTV